MCPTVSDVEEYATAFEEEYPATALAWSGSPWRPACGSCELLALRRDSVDLEQQEVRVHWQLDRYGVWPALVRPKRGQPRTAHLWGCYSDVAASLITDALAREGEDNGWLFPRHRSAGETQEPGRDRRAADIGTTGGW